MVEVFTSCVWVFAHGVSLFARGVSLFVFCEGCLTIHGSSDSRTMRRLVFEALLVIDSMRGI
jgi:hypothetical protein